MNRRKFIQTMSSLFLPNTILANNKIDNIHYNILNYPFKYYLKQGKKQGGKVLIIGGIHGNEEGGYSSSDLLVDLEIEQGTIAILPRSNPESIFKNLRGYNGDMNRKFAKISKKDPDYYKIESIKNFITNFNPNVIITLHDGYGFYSKNKNHWGECIVIDENKYNNLELGKIASFVSNNLKKYGLNIPINNTRTFQKNTNHKEQRKSLTYYSLETHNIPAFCIEASKQTNLKRKLKVQLLAINEFLNFYNVKLKNNIFNIIDNVNQYLNIKNTTLILNINGIKKEINKTTLLNIKKGSNVVFNVIGNRGSSIIPRNKNINYLSFYSNKNLYFDIKNDKKTLFSIKINQI